ncbi:hypothetical protein QBC47DRAFT_387255 [Echria macrotheca]|uniref:Uncharacterized protein n=1 Tax=Echria macrotheca TaxID=438768 RepID=A0AAJ0B9W4_9PEZI|nr:hypothetical protein QBC47DRAFT_387255 [Echria macrotheca]
MSFLILAFLFSGSCSAAALTTASPVAPGLKRDALVTRFSTIFLSGDPSQSRTAEIGFDCRVDLDHTLWGFCPTSVGVASDCGLAGNCIDRHACSRGCGKGGGLTTFTCTGTNGEFCSTAELYLTNNIGPFSYIACGGVSTTDRYSAFTTTPTTKTVASSVRSTVAAPSTPTSLAPVPTAPVNQPNVPASTNSPLSPSSAVGTELSSSTSSNMGAIIGGVIGCLALICLSAVAVVWLLKRHRNKSASNLSSVSEGSPGRLAPPAYPADTEPKPSGSWGPYGVRLSSLVLMVTTDESCLHFCFEYPDIVTWASGLVPQWCQVR